MVEETENLVLDILRSIRPDIDTMKSDLVELKASGTSLRKYFHNLQRDFLRQEQGIASIRVDIDLIKKRVELAEA